MIICGDKRKIQLLPFFYLSLLALCKHTDPMVNLHPWQVTSSLLQDFITIDSRISIASLAA